MKKDKTRAPSTTPESKQLASLRTKQEWHERLAQKHAASARRVWLRRILLEIDQQRAKGRHGAQTRAERHDHTAK